VTNNLVRPELSCIVWVGVVVGLEWRLLASIRDLREEERGVILLLSSDFTGVFKPSFTIGEVTAGTLGVSGLGDSVAE
jgi:hypothetical protein